MVDEDGIAVGAQTGFTYPVRQRPFLSRIEDLGERLFGKATVTLALGGPAEHGKTRRKRWWQWQRPGNLLPLLRLAATLK